MFDDLSYGRCCRCGRSIEYSPIRMPIGAPAPNPKNPWHYCIQYRDMCLECVRKSLDTFAEKIRRGELSPSSVWEGIEDPKIVSLPGPSPETKEKKSLFRRLWELIY